MRPRLQRGESDLSAGVSSPPSVALSSLHHLTSEGIEADFQDAVLNALRTLLEGQGRVERGLDLLKSQNGIASVSLPSARESFLSPSVIDRLRSAYSVDKAESNSPRLPGPTPNLGAGSPVGRSGSYPLRPFDHFIGAPLAEEETTPSSRHRFQTDAEKELPMTSHCQVHTRESLSSPTGLIVGGASGATVGTVSSLVAPPPQGGQNQNQSQNQTNHVGASASVASMLSSMPSSASAFHQSNNLHYLLNSHNHGLHHSGNGNSNSNAGGYYLPASNGAGNGVGTGVGMSSSLTLSRLRSPSLLAALEGAVGVQNGTTWPMTVKLRSLRYDEVKTSAWREALRLQESTSEPARHLQAGRGMDPCGTIVSMLEYLSVIAMLYDLFLLPVLVAWDIRLEGPLSAIAKGLICFWVVHMCACFTTGFFDAGTLHQDLQKVALHYLRTWFGFDFALLFCNVWSVAYGGKDDDYFCYQAVPYVRLLGLLRVIRLRQVLRSLWERVFDDDILVVLDTLWTLVGLYLLGHVLGCLWFFVGTEALSATGHSWQETILKTDDQTDPTRAFEYLTAVSWAFAHLSTGAPPVQATTTAERSITILAQIGGIFVLAIVVASATARLAQIRSRHHLAISKAKRMSSNLAKAQVPATLILAANKMAQERLLGRTKSYFEDVRGLEFLSLKLRAQLHFSICRRWLGHPLLEWWAATDPTSARSMCFCAVNFLSLRTGETLFAAVTEASAAFTLASGCLNYTQDHIVLKGGDCPKSVRVRQGSVLAEGALWCHWIHVGTAEAATPAEVVAIDAQSFFESISDSMCPTVFQKYASTFLSRLQATLPPMSSRPNDLHVPFASFEEVLTAMPAAAREAIAQTSMGPGLQSSSSSSCSISSWGSPWSAPSAAAASWLSTIFSASTSSSTSTSSSAAALRGSCRSAPLRSRLLEEVTRGECALILGPYGLRRAECFLGLKIKRPDDRVLVEMGVLTDQRVQATCCYPCKRTKEGETPAQSLQRLLASVLLPLSHVVEVPPDTERCLEHVWDEIPGSGGVKTICRASILTASICTVSATLALGKCPTIPLPSLPSPSATGTGPGREELLLYLLCEPKSPPPPDLPPLPTIQVNLDSDPKAVPPLSTEATRSETMSHYRFRLFSWLSEEEFDHIRTRRGSKWLLQALQSMVHVSDEQLDIAVRNFQGESQPMNRLSGDVTCQEQHSS